MSVSGEDSERMVGLLDIDNNGQISLDEFRRFVYLLPESLVLHAQPCFNQLTPLLHFTYACRASPED